MGNEENVARGLVPRWGRGGAWQNPPLHHSAIPPKPTVAVSLVEAQTDSQQIFAGRPPRQSPALVILAHAGIHALKPHPKTPIEKPVTTSPHKHEAQRLVPSYKHRRQPIGPNSTIRPAHPRPHSLSFPGPVYNSRA